MIKFIILRYILVCLFNSVLMISSFVPESTNTRAGLFVLSLILFIFITNLGLSSKILDAIDKQKHKEGTIHNLRSIDNGLITIFLLELIIVMILPIYLTKYHWWWDSPMDPMITITALVTAIFYYIASNHLLTKNYL